MSVLALVIRRSQTENRREPKLCRNFSELINRSRWNLLAVKGMTVGASVFAAQPVVDERASDLAANVAPV